MGKGSNVAKSKQARERKQKQIAALKKKVSPREAIKSQPMFKCKRCLQTFAGTSQKAELVTHCEGRHPEFNYDYCFGAAAGDKKDSKASAAAAKGFDIAPPPAKDTKDKKADKPAEKPAEKTTSEKPTSEKPAEKTTEKSADEEESTEKPAEKAPEKEKEKEKEKTEKPKAKEGKAKAKEEGKPKTEGKAKEGKAKEGKAKAKPKEKSAEGGTKEKSAPKAKGKK